MALDDLIKCVGCHTWQHKQEVCPKCGRRFPTEEYRIEAEKEHIRELKRKSAIEVKKVAQKQAGKSKERSKNLTMLCISKYEIDGELPPASVMSGYLYRETRTLITPQTMTPYLKQLGWVRMKNNRGWKKEE